MDYLSEEQPEYPLSLRIIRIEIAPGYFENLVTNLPELEFDIYEFKDLYHLWWSEENAFRDTKFQYQLNYSEGFKICRDFLRIHDGITVLDVEGLITQNIEAIRQGRVFARQQRFKLPLSFCYRN